MKRTKQNLIHNLNEVDVSTPALLRDVIESFIHEDDVGGALTAYKTADETKTNDATPSLDDDLQDELDANSFYAVVLFGTIVCGSIDPDITYGFIIPTGATLAWSNYWNSSQPVTTGTGVKQSGGSTAEETVLAMGYITTDDAGVFGLKWSQSTSSSLATTLKKGSWLQIVKLN